MNNRDDDKKEAPPPPSFAGPRMDNVGISFTMAGDEDFEETTRRVGFTPSFAPSNVSIEPMMAPQTHSTFSMAAPKVQAQSFSRPAKFQWSLPDAPTLPEFHPLERTAVFVPHTDASVVSGRISDVLRDRSIEASFDDTKGRARCVTADGVDFRVRLYRGRNQYSHGIIVEVQRRFGTSINFHSDTKAILDSAEGKTPSPPPTKPATLPLGPQDDNYTPSAGSSLGMVARMLNFPGYDAQYLALQTLTSLTDPAKMGFATSKAVSSELLGSSNDVGGKLLMLILSSPKPHEETFDLRVMAMNILANVLQVVAGNVPDSIKMQLRSVMKQDLRRAESNPRLATIAARCVEHLIENDRSASDIYYDALEAAYQVGNDRHAGLMRQAERCLQKIGAR
jgi:hypothetical protein